MNWHSLYVWIRSATFINYSLNVLYSLTLKNPGSGVVFWPGGWGHICPYFKIPVSGYEIHIYEYGTCYIPRNSFKLLWETSILSRWTWSTAKMTYHYKKSTNVTERQVHLPNTVFGISVTVFVILIIFENELVL